MYNEIKQRREKEKGRRRKTIKGKNIGGSGRAQPM